MAGKKQFQLSVILRAADKASKPLQAFNRRMRQLTGPVRDVQVGLNKLGREAGFHRLGKSLGRVGRQMNDVTSRAGKMGRTIGLALAGGGFGFKKAFIDPAATRENFMAVLEILEGGKDKAQKALDWVSNFAATTPYELEQVQDAFKQLRAYGLDPTNGLLKTLGDTSAAMGKPIMEAVEAIADAVTGENERLKEFGIKAEKNGNKIKYTYMQNGKQMSVWANANNRKQIEGTLTMIMNKKYSGAMEKRSKTWDGMISNMSDQWTRFANLVMDSGPFEFLKGQLKGVLDKINAMAADGSLQKWAERVGKDLVEGFKNMKAAVEGFLKGAREIWAVLKKAGEAISQVLPGFEDGATATDKWAQAGEYFAWVMGIFMVGKMAMAGAEILGLIGSIGKVGKALYSLGTALLTTPLGWFILAVTGVILVIQNWDDIVQWFSRQWAAFTAEMKKVWETSGIPEFWEAVVRAWDAALKAISQLINDLTAWISAAWIEIKGYIDSFKGLSLAEAGLKLFTDYWSGLKAVWTQLLKWLSIPLDALNGWIADITGLDLKQAGMDLINSLWDGLKAMWAKIEAWFDKAIKGMIDWMPDWVKEQLGIKVEAKQGAPKPAQSQKPSAQAEEALRAWKNQPNQAAEPPASDKGNPHARMIQSFQQQAKVQAIFKIEDGRKVQVKDVKQEGASDFDLSIDRGLALMGPG